MIPESLIQLGVAVVVLFIVYLIISVLVKALQGNDKDNSDVTKGLLALLTSLTANVGKNTDVLNELKAYISDDKKTTKTAISVLESRIIERFGMTDEKINTVIDMLQKVQKSLDETIPIKDELDKLDTTTLE